MQYINIYIFFASYFQSILLIKYENRVHISRLLTKFPDFEITFTTSAVAVVQDLASFHMGEFSAGV